MKDMRQKSNSGMTLVEIMIAIIVLSVIALGSSAFVMHSYRSLTLANQRTAATFLAENTLETLINSPLSSMPDPLPLVDDEGYLIYDSVLKKWNFYSTARSQRVILDGVNYDIYTMVWRRTNNRGSLDQFEFFDVNVNVRWNNNDLLGGIYSRSEL